MDQTDEPEIFSKTMLAAATATASDGDHEADAARKVKDFERAQKIEQLRQEIASGRYKPNVEGLSKRIIDEHLGS